MALAVLYHAALHGLTVSEGRRRFLVATATKSALLLPLVGRGSASAHDDDPLLSAPRADADADADDDPLAHWAFFGLAPPPVAGVLEYDALVAQARAGAFRTVQPAVQHDCLIATTHRGHRYASLVKDADVDRFVLDCMGGEAIPFALLPRDPALAAVHTAAEAVFDSALALCVADQWGRFRGMPPPFASSRPRRPTTKSERADDGIDSILVHVQTHSVGCVSALIRCTVSSYRASDLASTPTFAPARSATTLEKKSNVC